MDMLREGGRGIKPAGICLPGGVGEGLQEVVLGTQRASLRESHAANANLWDLGSVHSLRGSQSPPPCRVPIATSPTSEHFPCAMGCVKDFSYIISFNPHHSHGNDYLIYKWGRCK